MQLLSINPSHSIRNPIISFVRNLTYGGSMKKYWKRRQIVTEATNKTPLLLKLYYLWYCKRIEIKQCASMGTLLNGGAHFVSPPYST